MFDKVIAKVKLYDGRCTVKGKLSDVAKMYLGLREILIKAGCDFDKLHDMQKGVTIASEEEIRGY